MANTYTQIHLHFVFVVKRRKCLIEESFRDEVEKYLTGIIQKDGHKLLAIYCMPDHCHILIGFRPVESISDFTKDLKAYSSKWINQQSFMIHRFEWQSGYGCFSYAKSQLPNVIRYINNQPQHHAKKSFQQEYINMLEKFAVEYDEKYLFHPVK